MRSTHTRRAVSLGTLAVRHAAHALAETLEGRLHLTASGDQLLSTSPAVFMQNQGQFADSGIRYAYKGNGLNIGMTDQGMKYQFYNASGILQFDASLVNGRPVAPVGQDPAAATFSFLTDDVATRKSGVPSFSKVVYDGVYNGIDLQTYGLTNQLKYEFHIAPGADYRQIAVQYNGIEDLSINSDGSLQVNLGDQWGALKDDAPYIYQTIDGRQVQVAGKFILVDSSTYGFQITGSYDHSKELVIDPYIAWSSFIGGGDRNTPTTLAADTATTVVTDSGNNVIVGGSTRSPGWIDESLFNGKRFNDSGLNDGYVLKFSPDGALIWGVFVGGEYDDKVNGVTADSDGNVYAVGTSYGKKDHLGNYVTDDYGIIIGGGWAFGPGDPDYGDVPAVQGYHGGASDAFVMQISPQGQYEWATFVGGTGAEEGTSVALAGDTRVAISGTSDSTSGEWTGYAPWLHINMNPTFNIVNPGSIGVDARQTMTRAYDQPMAGTWSLAYTFPWTDSLNVSHMASYGVTLNYNATTADIQTALRAIAANYPLPAYLGGAADLANIVVTGAPFNSVFPPTIGFTFVDALGPQVNGIVGTLSADVSNIRVRGEVYGGGSTDAFAASFKRKTGAQAWAKYYGGNGDDTGLAIAGDSLNTFVGGATTTSVTWQDDFATGFLSGYGCRSVYLGAGTDGYMLHLNPENGRWYGDTYMNANENGTSAAVTAITLDAYSNPVVTGSTRISELWRFDPTGVNGPYTPPTTTANNEVFVAGFSNALVFARWATLFRANSAIAPGGVAVDPLDGTVLVGGTTNASAIQTFKVGGSPANVEFTVPAAAGSNGFVVKIDRQTLPVWGFFVGGTGSDSVNAVSIDSQHNALAAGTTTTGLSTNADGSINYANWPDSRFSNTNAGDGDGFVSKLSIDAVPPTVTVDPLTPVTADNYTSLTTYHFKVTYAASPLGDIDLQSVLGSTVAVTHNGFLTATAMVTATSSNTDAQSITATYSFRAPNGAWTLDDAGVYNLTLQGGQIRNVDGFTVASKDTFIPLGTFTVDRSRPVITITANNVQSLTAPSVSFTVLYDGQGSPISRYPTTLNLGSSSGSGLVTAASGAVTVDGNTSMVIYTVPMPAGGWKEGTRYTITISAATVFNAGNPNTETTGSFYVDSKVPTATFGKITSTATNFTVTYNGTGTAIGFDSSHAFPTSLVMSTKLSNGTILDFSASVASSADVTVSGTSTTVRYTIPRVSLSSTSHKYTITIAAGTVWDQAGNTNPKAVTKTVSLKGTAAKVISTTPSLPPATGLFSSLPLHLAAYPGGNPLLTTQPGLLV